MLYSIPATGVTVMVAEVVQVAGCWLATGLIGIFGAGATVIWKDAEIHPAASLTVTLYVPADTLVNSFDA